MSRAAAENEDLAPRAVSCDLCIEAPHSRANEEFDRVRWGEGEEGGGDRLYIVRSTRMRSSAPLLEPGSPRSLVV